MGADGALRLLRASNLDGAHAIGIDLEEIARMNVDKLKKRYPDGFASELSINRKAGDI